MIEELQTRWETKRDDPRFESYANALQDGLDKILKYYTSFDNKPAFVLSLRKFTSLISRSGTSILAVLHPYYGFPYIAHQWGGDEERENNIAAGNRDAKNWQDEAMKVLEDTVSFAKDVNGFGSTLTSILAR